MTNYIERYWRDATLQDAIKEPPMVARFRNSNTAWYYNLLVGWDRTDEWPWRSEVNSYEHCQVYDAPEPGEGWRLIDVDKETPQVGDEIYYPAKDGWLYRQHVNPYDKELTYRRRIEQPKPEPKYVPFEWEDREQLRGRWIVDGAGEQEYTIDDFFNDSGILYICGHPAEHFLNWRFVDTGEPVGKRVQ